MSELQFRLLDFHIYNEEVEDDNDSDSEGSTKEKVDNRQFIIQIFGLDDKGNTYCLYVDDFEPFFFIKVGDNWTKKHRIKFENYIRGKLGDYYIDSLVGCKLVKRKELYGFDDNKDYKFVLLKFKNVIAMNKVKNLFYIMTDDFDEEGNQLYDEKGKKKQKRVLKEDGLLYDNRYLRLYEANIPPLLRYFHIRDISPSGWVKVNKSKLMEHDTNETTCDYEYTISSRDLEPLNEEKKVPYKICSFDIEASSSHGDFPVPIKDYKKLGTNILDYWMHNKDDLESGDESHEEHIMHIIHCAFGYREDDYIDIVYPKITPKEEEVNEGLDKLLGLKMKDIVYEKTIDGEFNEEDEEDEDAFEMFSYGKKKKKKSAFDRNSSMIDILNELKMPRDEKLILVTKFLNKCFPKLEGDKVTFIGSTFMRYGEKDPYLNHCIALDTCSEVAGAEIEQYKTEKQVLLAWTKLIQRENPDIIIGYNIFGFDYKFMFYRAQENGLECLEEFIKLSRNEDEMCSNRDIRGRHKMEETSITIASGTHNLSYLKMKGRIQIDLYNYFRREFNLTSYKLDYVSGYFIGDKVKKLEEGKEEDRGNEYTKVYSKNLTGLKDGNYIHFEEIGHSSEYYDNGSKFMVYDVCLSTSTFKVEGIVKPDMTKTVKWCLAKDDVSPQDIFNMTKEGPNERAIIAKYCIQDCNLVHYLLNKIDIITGLVEMANICTVPIDFLIMRGQGIKLFSFVSKQCRLSNTLIPVLEKKDDGGYEGAIVLPPKSGLYLDEPVACVDYSSLYPSSMISENISHDSKVWAKEYDLEGNLINEVGIKDGDGNYIYDNMEKYEYVDVNYDTYEYLITCKDCGYTAKYKNVMLNHMREEHGINRVTTAAAKKTKVGSKVCRFVQFKDGELAIMPKILKELLAARKATRTSAKWKTIEMNNGDTHIGLVLSSDEIETTMKTKDGKTITLENSNIKSKNDTYDDFMKNVLDKRQLAIKVTANSLYGQCGARTSSFYEKDVAASTTATGRKLLTYGKRIIEEVYGDRICETKYGIVHSHAEYIYGDSVLGNTPIIIRNKEDGSIHIKRIDELNKNWKSYEEFKPFDTYISNRRDKQQSNIENYEIWTKSGWSNIKRVIRHKCNKKIYRITTPTSVVDVTEDHSLLDISGNKIKPNDCVIGTELLHNKVKDLDNYVIYENINKIKDKCNFNTKIEASKYLLYIQKQGINGYINILEDGTYSITNKVTHNKCNSIKVLYDSYDDFVYDIETEDGTFNTGFPLIVKNTDSVFMSFKLTNPETGEKIVGKEALEVTIELAKEAGELATKFLKAPHDLEYEKTFMPFCLLSKKRYVGMLYEEDPNSCYRKSMGIVLKRRDNAPIVKDVYGGIIDILMKDQDLQKAVDFTKKCLNDIADEKYPLDKLIITKSLNGFYKNPQQIAHKVLADRMGKRDPGNKPSVGDRIPFVYIETKGKKVLQGDKVEHPDYIKENKIRPDYGFYITNQIMKPVTQVFSLVLEDIPEYKKKLKMFNLKLRGLARKYKDDIEKLKDEEQKIRDAEVKALIFDDALRKCKLLKDNQRSIKSFFMK